MTDNLTVIGLCTAAVLVFFSFLAGYICHERRAARKVRVAKAVAALVAVSDPPPAPPQRPVAWPPHRPQQYPPPAAPRPQPRLRPVSVPTERALRAVTDTPYGRHWKPGIEHTGLLRAVQPAGDKP